MKIYIPEPCHENWGAMTPNEQGRFCGSCQKTVVDFTHFSAEDIQNYFAKHYGQKVCGRFKNQQLSAIHIQIPNTVFSYVPASRKFALALFIVFGTTLFSCTDNNGNSATIGKIEVVDTLKREIDTTEEIVVGKMAKEPPPVIKHPVDFLTTQGEVAYPEPETMGVPVENVIMGDTVFPEPIKHEIVKGKVKINQIDTLPKLEKTIIYTKGLIATDYKNDSIKSNSKE
jgi:hypothetical protein